MATFDEVARATYWRPVGRPLITVEAGSDIDMWGGPHDGAYAHIEMDMPEGEITITPAGDVYRLKAYGSGDDEWCALYYQEELSRIQKANERGADCEGVM